MLEQVKPAYVLINTTAEDELIEKIKAWTTEEDAVMEVRPAKGQSFLPPCPTPRVHLAWR